MVTCVKVLEKVYMIFNFKMLWLMSMNVSLYQNAEKSNIRNLKRFALLEITNIL